MSQRRDFLGKSAWNPWAPPFIPFDHDKINTRLTRVTADFNTIVAPYKCKIGSKNDNVFIHGRKFQAKWDKYETESGYETVSEHEDEHEDDHKDDEKNVYENDGEDDEWEVVGKSAVSGKGENLRALAQFPRPGEIVKLVVGGARTLSGVQADDNNKNIKSTVKDAKLECTTAEKGDGRGDVKIKKDNEKVTIKDFGADRKRQSFAVSGPTATVTSRRNAIAHMVGVLRDHVDILATAYVPSHQKSKRDIKLRDARMALETAQSLE